MAMSYAQKVFFGIGCILFGVLFFSLSWAKDGLEGLALWFVLFAIMFFWSAEASDKFLPFDKWVALIGYLFLFSAGGGMMVSLVRTEHWVDYYIAIFLLLSGFLCWIFVVLDIAVEGDD
jgi:O-antigen/teichoic acid export membrane protein